MLKELYNRRQFGIVENVVLLGVPVAYSSNDWVKARQVVSGRLINCYSHRDWMLKFVYRYEEFALNSPAGLCRVTCTPGIENVDVSGLVEGHLSYKRSLRAVMQAIELDIGEHYNTPPTTTECVIQARLDAQAIAMGRKTHEQVAQEEELLAKEQDP